MRATRAIGRHWRVAVVALTLVCVLGVGAVSTNALGAGDRFDRLVARVELILDPPPQRATVPTVVVTQRPTTGPLVTAPSVAPSAATAPSPSSDGLGDAEPPATPTPVAVPVREPVDVALVADHAAVFTSQNTTEMCAVAGTQMVLTILGLGDPSPEFQNEIAGRIDEWESWEDSHDGGWGPAAVANALAAYGAPGYEVRAYVSYTDALRDSAIAISATKKPVVMFPWWGAHTWVMTGYRADADPSIFSDATVTGAYILDPWYPRSSTIWGQSDPPGNFETLAELERNWPGVVFQGFGPGWSRPEGAYPERDGRYMVLIPTTP